MTAPKRLIILWLDIFLLILLKSLIFNTTQNKLLEFSPLSLPCLHASVMVWICQNNHYARANVPDRMGLHHRSTNIQIGLLCTNKVCHYCHYISRNSSSRKSQKKLLHWIKRLFKKRQKLWHENSVSPSLDRGNFSPIIHILHPF